jgi:chaperonin GroES
MSILRALHDKVILRKVESEEIISGGIIIPDNGKERANQYKVVDVGQGMYNPHLGGYYPMLLEVDDIVIVPKAVVVQVSVDGEEYFICREVDVLTVVTE